MLFCPKCGSILRPKVKGKKKVLYCTCGYSKSMEGEESPEIKEKNASAKKIEVVHDENETMPKIKITCEKCGNEVAYYWTAQTRAADEPETRFFKCTKCGNTWREYA